MKPKIIQVRGVALEKTFNAINAELLNILNNIHAGAWRVKEELNFVES